MQTNNIGKTILLIDQDKESRNIIRGLIEKSGYFHFDEISNANSSEELSEQVMKLKPCIIIFDINFNGIDPILFIEKICRKDEYCKPLIILSEATVENRIASALEAGASFYLDKAHLEFSLPGILNMIKSHEQTEKMLTQRDEELKSVIETQEEMICRFKPDTTLTFVNQAYANTFGIEPDKLIGRSFLDFVPAKEHESIKMLLSRFDASNPTVTYRHRVELPDGSTGWQEWTDYAFFDDEGSLTSFQSVGRDITNEMLLSKALEKSEEKERRLIARDLHDHIGQMLAYVKLRIENGIAITDHTTTNNLCHEILDLVTDCMQELRKVSRRVVAGFVKDEPLVETIRSLAESFEYIAKVKVKVDIVNVKESMNPEAKSNIYRIIQEAITNILKHAEATEVSIRLHSNSGFFNLSICDNGKGADIDSHMIKKGFVTMRHRVQSMQGEISFESEPGQFFKITIKLPEPRLIENNRLQD